MRTINKLFPLLLVTMLVACSDSDNDDSYEPNIPDSRALSVGNNLIDNTTSTMVAIDRVAYFTNIAITALHQLSATDGNVTLPCDADFDGNIIASLQQNSLQLSINDCLRPEQVNSSVANYSSSGQVTLELSQLAKQGNYLTFEGRIDINLTARRLGYGTPETLTASATLIQTISAEHETLLQITIDPGTDITFPFDEKNHQITIDQGSIEKILNYKMGQYTLDIDIQRADGLSVSTPTPISGFIDTIHTSGILQGEDLEHNVFTTLATGDRYSINSGLVVDGVSDYYLGSYWSMLNDYARYVLKEMAYISFPYRNASIPRYHRFNENAEDAKDIGKAQIQYKLIQIIPAQAPYYASIRYIIMPMLNETELLSAQISTVENDLAINRDIDFEFEVDGPWLTLHLYQPLPTEVDYIFHFFPMSSTNDRNENSRSSLDINNDMFREAQ